MLLQILEKLNYTIKNFDKKIINILKYGFKFCLFIAIISFVILFIYLFFVHSVFLYQLGITVFELSICFVAEFIVSAIAVDTIMKQLN